MRRNREELLSPFRAEKPAFYHYLSRCVDRAFKFGGAERDEFVKIMRLCEDFSGVRVLGGCSC